MPDLEAIWAKEREKILCLLIFEKLGANFYFCRAALFNCCLWLQGQTWSTDYNRKHPKIFSEGPPKILWRLI